MANKFKWSELELQNTADEITLEDLLGSIADATIEEHAELATFDEMDFTIIEGFCPDCGEPFSWSGLFRDMPESFCDCSRRR